MGSQLREENIAGNFYDKHNSKNPITRFFVNQFYSSLSALVKQSGAKTALEIGCGEGHVTNIVAKKCNIEVEGSDASPEIISLAKTLYPNLTFSVKDAYNLDLDDGSFDLVMAIETLEHLKKPETALKEIKRVTRNYAIVSVPREPLWSWVNLARFKYWVRMGNTPGHVQHWNKKSFKKMLDQEFSEVRIETPFLWMIALCKKK